MKNLQSAYIASEVLVIKPLPRLVLLNRLRVSQKLSAKGGHFERLFHTLSLVMTGFIPTLMKEPFSIHGVPETTENPKGMGFLDNSNISQLHWDILLILHHENITYNIEMGFFQNSVTNKYLKASDKQAILDAYSRFKNHFHNPIIQENIRNSKEEQYQGEFLIDLFVNILGYTKNPTPGFNLTTEYKNVKDSKKADGAIILKDIVKAVIELKGTETTDLGKIENQAFGYKNNQPECLYVIISNFEKLRFYIDNTIEFIEFNLFTLTETEFELLFLCLGFENIEKDIPKKIKEESLSQEDQITKQLYNDYSLFKRELHQNLVALNPQFDPLTLFKKSQKLLDRFLFLFFAEDKFLLPPNSVRLILDDWRDLQDRDVEIPLYDRFKKYFDYLNTGFKGKRYDVFAYNGGLFKLDETLDKLRIDDELLFRHTFKLAEYDFASEVDVNILGHIFENSLNELDEIKAQLEGIEIDKTKSKRKKDGVFYTPKYITKYIVDSTIGRLCNDKKAELQIIEEVYSSDKKRQKKTTKALAEKLTEYRNWLLQLTICDPACGSGAFLNQALNFLIAEHRYIDELQAKLFGDSLVLSDFENSILENNLFGVDLNEESVEIAKLSLWLRTAQLNRKLNDLNNNIKCGNSLIDDPVVAGDKAFNWQKEFPHVFKKGGFDIVIGNPPYVRVQQLDYNTIDHLKIHYKTAVKRIDISLCFIELSSRLIKSDLGITAFITSNQFLTTEYGKSMRSFLLNDYQLIDCVDFGDLPIFSDALTYVSIFSFKKCVNNSFTYFNVDNVNNAVSNNFGIPQIIDVSQLTDANWNLKNFAVSSIFRKIFHNCKEISDIGNAWYGIVTGSDSIFIFTRERFNYSEIERELFKPLLRAQNCSRYYCFESEKYVLYPYKFVDGKTILLTEEELQKQYPNAYKYLISHKAELESRKDSRNTFKGRDDWYCLTRFGQLNVFNKDKIVTPGEVKDHKFCIDTSKAGFSGARVFAITIEDSFFDLKYVLCVLNSSLIRSYLQSFSSLKSGGFYTYSSNILNRIPIKNITKSEQLVFIDLVDKIFNSNKNLYHKRTKFLSRVVDNFEKVDINTSINKFDEFEFKYFIQELSKQKIKLSLNQQDEWCDYFNSNRDEIVKLKAEIDINEIEINRLVNILYGLSADEILILENPLR